MLAPIMGFKHKIFSFSARFEPLTLSQTTWPSELLIKAVFQSLVEPNKCCLNTKEDKSYLKFFVQFLFGLDSLSVCNEKACSCTKK
ncbi:hypothetical protein BpHYR1_018688 [Brachionus plicatilis]|uniref:Uncharacterized protein n=1 Tax=Brachionus plicatilis TaxID=10195 RepID=A0A3M7S602_BRAPC|nr:hypothetical protein BpHYR1_018688 [Brachionus plicatilis]